MTLLKNIATTFTNWSLDAWTYCVNQAGTVIDQKYNLRDLTPKRPATETEMVVSGEIELDCMNVPQVVLEPRYATGSRTITEDFDLSIFNKTNTVSLTATFSLTGTRVITMADGDVTVSNPSSIGTWTPGADTLQLDAGTDDIIEFSFLYDATSDVWDLKVGEVRV